MTTSPSWRLVALLALFSRARFGELTLRGQARAADERVSHRRPIGPSHSPLPLACDTGLAPAHGAWEPGSLAPLSTREPGAGEMRCGRPLLAKGWGSVPGGG